MAWGRCQDCTFWYRAQARPGSPVRCQNDRSVLVFLETRPLEGCMEFGTKPEDVYGRHLPEMPIPNEELIVARLRRGA